VVRYADPLDAAPGTTQMTPAHQLSNALDALARGAPPPANPIPSEHRHWFLAAIEAKLAGRKYEAIR
jgi:hypothetical protein